MNNDVIAQRIADAVLTNALARLASTYGLRLVPAVDVPSESETNAPREPSSDTLPSSPETPQPYESNP